MQPLSNQSLARVLSDIAVVLSAGDEPVERLKRAVDLLRQVVPYGQCGLLTLQPHEEFLAWPASAQSDQRLRDTVHELFTELIEGEGRPASSWPQSGAAHLAVPLVSRDVQIVGVLLLRRESAAYAEVDLRVVATVASQLGSYVSWLQHREERAILLAREQAARAEAEQANRAKDAFLATLSHELRSPLNAIVGWSDMLLRGSLPPETIRRALEAIHRSGRAQAHLIDDVLDVSRIVSGRLFIETRLIDLTQVVHAAVEAIRPTAGDKGVRLVAHLPNSPTPLTGDPNRLQQVFANLLSNAVKFTPAGGHISVSLATRADRAHVRVADTGIGIERETLPRVFDRFFQHDSRSTRRHTGLGLGLAIVKNIVEQHGGTVTVESDGEGKGAAFTVALQTEVSKEPGAELLQPESGTAADGVGPDVRLDGLSVLVVDDEAETRDLLATLLGELGIAVTVATGADEAMSRIGVLLPDVVISDIAMPGKDGFALIREVRERGLTMPAIALSAHGRGEDRALAMAAGFDLHLAKPVLPGDVVTAIGIVSGRRVAP